MKRLLALMLLIAAPAMAQVIGGDRLNKTTNGGIVADSNNGILTAPYHGSTAPSSPTTGEMWCDDNFSPCQMKRYNGSSWDLINAVTAFSVQANPSPFPSSPSDGQSFFDKANSVVWVYNATKGLWCRADGANVCTSTNLTDNFTSATIANPTTAPSGAMAGSGGSMTAGTHQFCYTDANSSGGETLCSSNSVNFTAVLNDKFNATGILTGATGTTARRIYMSKAGTTTPMYWVGTISDNSTTTFSVTAADASLVTDAPTVNFSGALAAGGGVLPTWTATNNSTATTSGGCGETGSMLIIRASNALALQASNVSADTIMRCAFDLSSFNSGNYVVQFEVNDLRRGFSNNAIQQPYFAGARVGNVDGAIRFWIGGASWTGPPSSSNFYMPGNNCRTTASSSSTSCGFTTATTLAWPTITTFPMWVRFVKKGSFHQFYNSSDGKQWVPTGVGANVNTESASAVTPTSPYTQFEFPIAMSTTGTDLVIEVSNLTLTVF